MAEQDECGGEKVGRDRDIMVKGPKGGGMPERGGMMAQTTWKKRWRGETTMSGGEVRVGGQGEDGTNGTGKTDGGGDGGE